ncbi:uncharacterized protein LOC129757941 [Uranotaenia lowii]|uniref:uncharacterized protein LOC129757941 n=1 Tax=Uranotaenia lowii TaxID=190385 RepID=UPI00247955AE|nr:uncharacterized protein LOC129757941 [Uranotaenia lowii]
MLLKFVLLTIGIGSASISLPEQVDLLLCQATADILEESFTVDVRVIRFSLYLTSRWNSFVSRVLVRVDNLVPVLIDRMDKTPMPPKVRHNVILLDSTLAFEMFRRSLNKQIYDFTGFYLIVVLQRSTPWMPAKILKLMSDLLIFNVLVVYCEQDNVLLYTYFPFGSLNSTKPYVSLWNFYQSGTFNEAKPNFPFKAGNLFTTSLNVALFDIEPFMMISYDDANRPVDFKGIDGYLLKCLSTLLNFTIIPHIEPLLKWGELQENGTATGATALLLNRTANFTLGFFGYSYQRLRFMSTTFSYHQTFLDMVVSPGLEYGRFEKLLLPFHKWLWINFIAVLLIGIITIIILGSFPVSVNSIVYGSSNQTPMLNFFRTAMGFGVTPFPKQNIARTLLILWIFCMFMLRTVYQQIMFKNLYRSQNRSTVDNWPQFVAEDYRIYAIPRELYLFNGIPQYVKKQFTLIHISEIDSTLLAIRSGNLRGARVTLPEQIHYMNQKTLPTGNPEIYRLFREHLYSYSLGIFFWKDSPLVEPFDYHIRNLVTHGFIECWKDWTLDRHLAKAVRRRMAKASARQMSTAMLSGVFGLYAMGMVLAIVTFGVELLLHSWCDRHRTSRGGRRGARV